jgi:hypothetical protein
MNINAEQVNQVLNVLPYPLSKDVLVEQARKHNLPDQAIGILDKLPDKTFNSADDVKGAISGLSNTGDIGSKIGGLFK